MSLLEKISDTVSYYGPIVLGILVGAALAWFMVYLDEQSRKACADLGGQIISKGSPGFGVGGNGQVVSTYNSVSFCVSPDGRILG